MKHTPGFAILLVLAMTALASLLLLHAWFVTGLNKETIQLRQQWYHHFFATESAMNVGLELIKAQFDDIYEQTKKSAMPLVVDLTSVLQTGSKRAKLMVTNLASKGYKSSLALQAELWASNKSLCHVRCVIKKVVTGQQEKKDIHYVVSHYTLGSSV